MKHSGIVALLFAGLLPAVSFAVDPPHWTSATRIEDCTTSCHLTHGSLGSTLTQASSNVNLCQSCHNAGASAGDLPINSIDIAIPHYGGTSHAFNVPAVNATYSTQTPSDTQMQLRVMGGKIVCSTCHDQHDADSAMGGTPHISQPKKITAFGSLGVPGSTGVYTGAGGAWYLVEITTSGSETTAKFRYSKDNGTTWMASNLTAGPNVALDNGVVLGFGAGSYNAPERWQFYAAWPFLRAAMDSGDNATGSKYCRDCHTNWVMTHTSVETYDGSYKNHPVGQALNANGRGYDRAAPLDGNGAAGSTDGNPTNDLVLDGSANVQCYSCHGVHHADSNTETKDLP